MTVIKQPGGARGFDYDFSAMLGDLTVGQILSATSTPRDGGANLVETDRGYSGQIVRIVWSGGEEGETYATTVRIEDSSGFEHELDGEIIVREINFVVPPIEANPYLSADDYVDRFGREETIRITDEAKTGTIDAARLGSAISDATQEAEGYLAAAYDLPLSEVPPILRNIVADLARERLHRTRPTDAVKAAADRARTMLRDLSAGRMKLNLTAGAEAPQRASSLAVWADSNPPRVFNSDKMAGWLGQ